VTYADKIIKVDRVRNSTQPQGGQCVWSDSSIRPVRSRRNIRHWTRFEHWSSRSLVPSRPI